MLPLAVSGQIVIALAVAVAILVLVLLFRAEDRYNAQERAEQGGDESPVAGPNRPGGRPGHRRP